MWTAVAISCFATLDAHEFLSVPPARTGDCKLNAVVFGSAICKNDQGNDVQCKDDPLMYSYLFNIHPAYANNACGGSLQVDGGHTLLQACGDISTDPDKFDMRVPGPEAVTEWTAGSEVEVHVHGFLHPGVNRLAMCFHDDSDCTKPEDFNNYILAYHFTEGAATDSSSPENIYGFDSSIKIKLPNRNGRAVFQWLVHADDVRSYVSCSDVSLSGASGGSSTDSYTCNGHPLCDCTTAEPPSIDTVGLHRTCPQGTTSGVDIVKQYKDQVGVEEFCKLCLTDGCPSTCGGKYLGFYQGPKCTNAPVLPGCGNTHQSGLPRYVECTPSTCKSFGWLPGPSPSPVPPSPTPVPPSPTPVPPIPGCPSDAQLVKVDQGSECLWSNGYQGLKIPPNAVQYCDYFDQGYFGYYWSITDGFDYPCAPSAAKSDTSEVHYCVYNDGQKGVSIPSGAIPDCSNLADGHIGFVIPESMVV